MYSIKEIHLVVQCRMPIWYEVKLVLVAWLVLPQFKGAAFLYERFVRQHILNKGYNNVNSPSVTVGKVKNKFMDFITTKKVS